MTWSERLGRVGVWLGAISRLPAADERDAVRRLEAAGLRTLWFGEALGSRDAIAHAGLLLAWTERATIATGIAGIYSRDAVSSASSAATFAEAYPGRFLLGLGVSHAPLVEGRGAAYERPLGTMRAYLDGMEAAPYRAPAPRERAPVVLAALGPRMLELARDRTDGAHPYFVPPEHTRRARDLLGDGPLLAPEQALVPERDAGVARARAREHMAGYLTSPNYTRNLRRLGFGDDDIAGPSDRLVDAIVAWGDADALCARVRAHLDAGADHVCVQALGPRALDELLELAPALLAL